MSTLKLFSITLILLVSTFPFLTFTTLAISKEDEAVSALNNAEEIITLAYQIVLEAENAGADVSGLLIRLNVAGELLAGARISYRLEDFDDVVHSANLCYKRGENVRDDAYMLRDLAIQEEDQHFRFTMIWSLLGVTIIICASLGGWIIFKRRYFKHISRTKPEVF